MVTRFVTSPPTDNCPQPKDAQPLSQLDIRLILHFDSSAHGLVRRWLLIGYFPILYYPTGTDTVRARINQTPAGEENRQYPGDLAGELWRLLERALSANPVAQKAWLLLFCVRHRS